MVNKMSFRSNCTVRQHFVIRVLCILVSFAYSQESQVSPSNVADSLNKLQQEHFGLVNIDTIARAGAVQAIPALKKEFVRSQDPVTKKRLASALVTRGDKDPEYWDFLTKLAAEAVESDAPEVSIFDAQGKMVPRQLSPEFIEWAKIHNVSAVSWAEAMVYKLPGYVLLLGETGDPRGLQLVRQALSSPNYLIQAMGAIGTREASG